jgi:hypothetical protein
VEKFPSLRGGGYCAEGCWVIVLIIIVFVIGFILISVGGAVYYNDINNTAGRNALIAGSVFLALSILCCLAAICRACQDSCEFCCDCHLGCR